MSHPQHAGYTKPPAMQYASKLCRPCGRTRADGAVFNRGQSWCTACMKDYKKGYKKKVQR